MPKSRNRRKPAKGLKVPKHERYLQQKLPVVFNCTLLNVEEQLKAFRETPPWERRNGTFGAISKSLDVPDLDAVRTYR